MAITRRFVVQSTIFLLGVGFLTLLAIVGMTIWLGEKAQIYSNDAIEARDTRISAVELRSAIQSAESSQRGFVMTGNEIYLAPYDSAKGLAERHFGQLKQSLAPYSDTAPMLARLSTLLIEKIDEMDQTIGLKKALRNEEALALFRTNRGKALMDEANVFLSSIIRKADERLTTGVTEQQENAQRLRLLSIVGGLVIFLVVGGVTITILRYARDIAQARDEVRDLNISLEQRVKDRTADLGRARDRAEVLLAEVNHRVANSLAMVSSLVRLQSKAVKDDAARSALGETEARIFAISLVHKRLYSSGDARVVALDEYLSVLLSNLEISMRDEGHGASLKYELEPLKMKTDDSVNLGVVVTEWVTNAFKYAYPDRRGEVRVRLKRLPDGRAELVVEDDGVGRGDDGVVQGTGLGTRLVTAMAGSIGAEVAYISNQPGTTAQLIIPIKVE